ncbi:PfkB family carbohydrate kinase [uncultured Campylobacter sp.]|uniref:PfkB family carbohydrate kinase n=1 Tax=uncultured Campylobacter sp. TaxID=218934 RepID=UPI002605E845|nr:PfkB family carbohydrate kinase [uncultured Campylobacter sp.]
MRKVIGIGETVLDIIFKDNKPVNAVPGGSAFNAIISLGRAGISAHFIGEVGHDRVGTYILDFLKANHVDGSNVEISPEGQSHLSLAFLDEGNNADYLFYKDHAHDSFSMCYPEINRDDIVLFSSFFAPILVYPEPRPRKYT